MKQISFNKLNLFSLIIDKNNLREVADKADKNYNFLGVIGEDKKTILDVLSGKTYDLEKISGELVCNVDGRAYVNVKVDLKKLKFDLPYKNKVNMVIPCECNFAISLDNIVLDYHEFCDAAYHSIITYKNLNRIVRELNKCSHSNILRDLNVRTDVCVE